MRIVHMNNQLAGNPVLKSVFKANKPAFRSRFLVNKGNGHIVLPVDEVAYVYVNEELLYAVTFDKKEYHIDSNMKTLEQELNPSVFFRANRQFIVNVHSIERFEPYFNGKLVIKTLPESKEKIIVSRIKAKSFREWIDS